MAGLPSTWRGEEVDMCACGDVEVCSGRGGEVCFELWVIVVGEKKDRGCNDGGRLLLRLAFCGSEKTENENENENENEQQNEETRCEWVVSV
jgi:hypothetical protein